MDSHRNGLSLAAIIVGCLVAALTLGACGKDDPSVKQAKTLQVPADYSTIEAAVDEANRGDLILIGPGTYNESVTVTTDGVTIRGTDRNEVILDGENDKLSGITVIADGVTVENLTVHNYRQSGVVFDGFGRAEAKGGSGEDYEIGAGERALNGYRAAYVTSYDNGTYGIYAFGARNGVIEHSYVSGHPDSGIYIGQCQPCNAIVRDSIAEKNAIGYLGTNASGDVYVVNNRFVGNRIGLTPNSQDMELLAPQAESYIAGNFIDGSGAEITPAQASGGYGIGLAIGGGTKNQVLRNRVIGAPYAGIALTTLNSFDPKDNRIEENVTSGNGVDLFSERVNANGAVDGNCFAGNEFRSAAPSNIERSMPCQGDAVAAQPARVNQVAAPPDTDYRTLPAPGAQPTMPGDLKTIPRPLPAMPAFPELAGIAVPK